MKKMILLLFVACFAMAGIEKIDGYSENAIYYQFSHDPTTDTGNWFDLRRADQNWEPAQMIRLNVPAKMDIWLSNYVSSWYDPKPLLALDGNVFDMSAGYGIVQTNATGVVEHVSGNVGNNNVSVVTYNYDANPSITNSTAAYFLGSFEAGDEIGIWLTTLPTDGGEEVDTLQYVKDDNHNTTLVSRIDDYQDLAGNVRINFGINSLPEGLIAREFVAVGVSDDKPVEPSGQPLPGLFTSALLAFGSIGLKKVLKKK